MTGFVRVYSKESHATFNFPADADLEGLDVIEGADTHDIYGAAIPPEYGVERKPANKSKAAEAKEAQK